LAINCPKCDSENTDTPRFCSNCATPLEPSKDIEVAKTLETPIEQLTTGSTLASRYQIIEELKTSAKCGTNKREKGKRYTR